MKNFTIYLVLLLCFFASKMLGQETFEKRVKNIASKIESITIEEKSALKKEVEAINNQLINRTISREEAESKKKLLAETRALNIETRVALEQEALKNLVQEKVDGKIKTVDTVKIDSRKSVKIYLSDRKNKNDTIKKLKSEKRTTSQFVFAAGLNNVITNKQIAHSDFRYFGSHFYELGLTFNSRILKNDNLLHAKYGLSLMYNNLRPSDNRNFIINGNQTNLELNAVNMKDSRFRNVYLVAPVHLEFDFSKKEKKNDKPYFNSHQGFRLGIGGYAGINLKSKQIIIYDNTDFNRTERTRGDFNTSNFIYGLSSYIGYKETSLYVKYDLNPLFADNTVKQNNVSIGVRFDFN